MTGMTKRDTTVEANVRNMTEAERDALLLRIADQLAELPKMAAQLAEVLRIVEALPERQMATMQTWRP